MKTMVAKAFILPSVYLGNGIDKSITLEKKEETKEDSEEKKKQNKIIILRRNSKYK